MPRIVSLIAISARPSALHAPHRDAGFVQLRRREFVVLIHDAKPAPVERDVRQEQIALVRPTLRYEFLRPALGVSPRSAFKPSAAVGMVSEAQLTMIVAGHECGGQ